ncbi:MAG: DMT family transporter [Pseudomonadota bacterium]
MRLVFLLMLTMTAFAANSLLTRLAVSEGHSEPATFAMIRVLSGAGVLIVLVALRDRDALTLSRMAWPGAFSLTIYMLGFSLAYSTLDAGLGALILFGVVQLVMFAHAALGPQRPNTGQIAGSFIAFAGLIVLLWPETARAVDPLGAALMGIAGVGWAAYTIIGQRAIDPLAATMRSFVLCFPMTFILFIGMGVAANSYGVLLAVICGAATSALGYALWYAILPGISGPTAAVSQLSVPVITLFAGVLLLGESLTLKMVLAAVLVLSGVGGAIRAKAAV